MRALDIFGLDVDGKGVRIVGERGGHVAPVDEVVDRPLCEERARAKSLLAVVNAAKAKKSKRDGREGAYRLPGEVLLIH